MRLPYKKALLTLERLGGGGAYDGAMRNLEYAKRRGAYASAVRKLEAAGKRGIKPGLSRVRILANLLSNPQGKFKSIIVAGTNGKGSTTAMISSILQSDGCIVGSYYSPHVFAIEERMQINGKYISKKEFSECLSSVLLAIEKNRALFRNNLPTYFEILTAAAFSYFASKGADYAVLEVGMGGRLDATNIVDAEICCITSIGLDHTQFLGKTLRSIAFEKAGIAKKGKFLVCANGIPAEAMKEIKSSCKKAGAKFAMPKSIDAAIAKKARLRLEGDFQRANAATAACAARLLGICKKSIQSGLSKAWVPARMQTIGRKPKVIIDSAHNPQAAANISTYIKKTRPAHGKSVLLFSSMKDKDYLSSLKALSSAFDSAVVFSPPFPRAEKTGKLEAAALKAGFSHPISAKSPKAALALAASIAGKNGIVLACGSIYSLSHLFASPSSRLTQ